MIESRCSSAGAARLASYPRSLSTDACGSGRRLKSLLQRVSSDVLLSRLAHAKRVEKGEQSISLGATLPERVSAAVEQFQRLSNDVVVLTGPDVWVDGTEDWCKCFGRVGGRVAALSFLKNTRRTTATTECRTTPGSPSLDGGPD